MSLPSWSIAAGIGLLLLLQGCALRLQGAHSEREFRREVASHPYVADAQRAHSIIAGAGQVKICSRTSEVRRLMGEPDFGVQTYDSSGVHTAVRWTYLLSEESAAGARRAVEVGLNAGGYVFSITPQGVSGI